MTVPERRLVLAGLIVVAAAGSLTALPTMRGRPERLAPQAALTPTSQAKTGTPSLYCDFFDVMHRTTIVSFDFGVDREGTPQPRFTERFVVELDGSRQIFGAEGTERPVWSFGLDDGTPTLRSSDGETRIVLYGIKLDKPDIIWTEAGIRSNSYKNLEGKCRQGLSRQRNRRPHTGAKGDTMKAILLAGLVLVPSSFHADQVRAQTDLAQAPTNEAAGAAKTKIATKLAGLVLFVASSCPDATIDYDRFKAVVARLGVNPDALGQEPIKMESLNYFTSYQKDIKGNCERAQERFGVKGAAIQGIFGRK